MRQNTFIIAWILFLVNLNKICDHFHKLFIAHGRRVQTEIIISGVIPVSSGIIAVIFRAVLVDFLNPSLRFLLLEAVLVHHSCDAVLLRRTEIQFDDIRIIPE